MDEDVLSRARQAVSDYRWSKICKVEASADRAYRLLEELADEFGRLRSSERR